MESTLESVVDNAYVYGRDWISQQVVFLDELVDASSMPCQRHNFLGDKGLDLKLFFGVAILIPHFLAPPSPRLCILRHVVIIYS